MSYQPSHVPREHERSLKRGYQAMAGDVKRENDARPWLGGLFTDVNLELEGGPQVLRGGGMSNPTGAQTEFANRSRLITRLFEMGFEVFTPVIDAGIDLAVYRHSDKMLKLIQLKTRWTIDRKYFDRDIWIAFPGERLGEWFIAPHDEMVQIGEQRGYCRTSSWLDKGLYHLTPLPHSLNEAMAQWRVLTAK